MKKNLNQTKKKQKTKQTLKNNQINQPSLQLWLLKANNLFLSLQTLRSQMNL